MKLVMMVLVCAAVGCGSSSKSGTTPEAPAEATPVEAPAVSTPVMGPDECCCPFASAEGVDFNVSPRAACEEAGSECVDADRCEG